MQRQVEIKTVDFRFDKIELNKVLRKSTNMGLADSKKAVDTLLNESVVQVYVDDSKVGEFVDLVEELGLLARVD